MFNLEIVPYHTLCLYGEYAVLCGNKVLLNLNLNFESENVIYIFITFIKASIIFMPVLAYMAGSVVDVPGLCMTKCWPI